VASFDLKEDITALDFSPDTSLLNFAAANKEGQVKTYMIQDMCDEDTGEPLYDSDADEDEEDPSNYKKECNENFVFRRHTDSICTIKSVASAPPTHFLPYPNSSFAGTPRTARASSLTPRTRPCACSTSTPSRPSPRRATHWTSATT
jgi:hypothetical protein